MKYDDSKTRANNRKRIVNAARYLFIEKGIAHTAITDIVNKVKMERKTFYNYFSNKEEIADYIYYQEMKKYYKEDFGPEVYKGLNTGYEKIKRYLTTIVEHFERYSHEMLFAVHYDYYFRKQATKEVISKIYEECNVVEPDIFFIEGIEDGSIDIEGEKPEVIFGVIAQSIGAYASRIIFRGYKLGVKNVEIDFSTLYDLLNLHLKSIKAS